MGLGQLGGRIIALGQDVRRLELWAAAAAAAREVLREAMASKSCAWWTLFVALKARALHVVHTHTPTTAYKRSLDGACRFEQARTYTRGESDVHCMRTAYSPRCRFCSGCLPRWPSSRTPRPRRCPTTRAAPSWR